MPSYYRARHESFVPRHVFLSNLRQKRMRRRQLLELIERITPKIAPRSRRLYTDEGYSEARVTITAPKLPKFKFYQLFYKLKRQGLIALEKDTGNDPFFRLTAKGLVWLKEFNAKPHFGTPTYASPEKSNRITIVSYDIPEKQRFYRDWLRSTLRNLDMNQLQKSLWVGKIKIPSEFIADITRFKLDRYVEIFEITKSGTLRHRL